MQRGSLIPVALAALTAAACELPAAEDGVVFMYHHVDAATPASTSVTPEAFADQLDFLEREGFHVLPLLELIEGIESGAGVPERSVAITFDDGYRSVLTRALPELRARGWPFTVFVNTEAVDNGFGGVLGWDELRALGDAGATIGNHSVTHAHLVRELDGESRNEWRRRAANEIAQAEARLRAEVGDILVPIFAYPYGEYTAELKEIVADQGLYGFGQHSGAIGPESDFLALPRYPVATSLELTASDFALRARSRALPVRIVGPEEHIVGADPRPPVRLAVTDNGDLRLAELACYASGQGRMSVQWADDAMTEFVAVPERALGAGRSKYNCTVPSQSAGGVYYWYAWLWMRRHDDGRWYDE